MMIVRNAARTGEASSFCLTTDREVKQNYSRGRDPLGRAQTSQKAEWFTGYSLIM